MAQSSRGAMTNRSKSASKQKSPDVAILDDNEQDQVTAELQEQANRQASSTRTRFFYLLMILAAIHVGCLIATFIAPFEIQHQRHFKELVTAEGFYAFYVASTYCYIIAAFIAKDRASGVPMYSRLAAYLLAGGTVLAWALIFRQFGVSHPGLYWMPISNILGLALAHYVDYDSTDLVTSAKRLEEFKYSFKGV